MSRESKAEFERFWIEASFAYGCARVPWVDRRTDGPDTEPEVREFPKVATG